ncbi:hypothetical protein GGI42DRAFT_252809 [Trichoderma sp. SZMC 28013]
MLVRVSASFVAGQSADLAPCTPSGLNGDLCQRGNKTEGKRKGKTPGMQAYPAYKCQYTALLQSPEDTKMGRSRQVAGMSTLLLVVSSRARAAPTRTPMLRETDSRHRSTRRDQMLCHRSPRLYIASRRCFVLGQLHHCPCLADMAVLLSDEQTTIRFNQRWRTFSRGLTACTTHDRWALVIGSRLFVAFFLQGHSIRPVTRAGVECPVDSRHVRVCL